MSGTDEEEGPSPGLFPPLYWAAIGSGLVLMLAGAVVGLIGPALLAGRPAPHAPRPALTAPMVRGRGAGRIPDHS